MAVNDPFIDLAYMVSILLFHPFFHLACMVSILLFNSVLPGLEGEYFTILLHWPGWLDMLLFDPFIDLACMVSNWPFLFLDPYGELFNPTCDVTHEELMTPLVAMLTWWVLYPSETWPRCDVYIDHCMHGLAIAFWSCLAESILKDTKDRMKQLVWVTRTKSLDFEDSESEAQSVWDSIALPFILCLPFWAILNCTMCTALIWW